MVAAVAAVVVTALGLAWLVGPREPLGTDVPDIALPADLDGRLANGEAEVPALRPGAAKEIVYAYPASKAKTPLAIVYIHGFSASKTELRPLPDQVARALGANLFLTRLAGHGRDGAAMGEPTVQDWLNDYAEAIAVGRRLGETVLVIANSTGAALATYASALGDQRVAADGLVLLSPNYRLADWRAFVLTLPFARSLVPVLIPEHEFQPQSAAHAAGWTTRYPGVALIPMAALAKAARSAPVERISTPALFVVSPTDRIIDPATVRDVAARWGGPIEMVTAATQDPAGHVLAGDAVSPNTTTPLAGTIIDWVRRSGLESPAPTIR